MLKEHAKLMGVFAACGEVIGRKKLQKMIYIAKKISFPFQEKFEFHFYGPYSEELTLRVEELCNMEFIDEVREKKGGYYQYRYTLTTEGEAFLEHAAVDIPCLRETVAEMNNQSARFLELVSTVLYFDTLTKEEVAEKIFTLKRKQRYTEEEIQEAYTYIEKLKNNLQ
ncbi:YwgA family protein [Bacillus badius]|uniref:YwgA family protein n=1 Tax=Bacillus badius TaxID=1455 RepID=A0ABR5AVH7_BACBA|nr:YwgA family protein [Bacillus badius]KIL76601.1 hypothetical protein SD78_0703 [Bacillus badius]KIL78719.1 hypothetical protein SD77_4399 [Bacillus badius]MED4717993.1 YwgA family protein [Bacillus badius]